MRLRDAVVLSGLLGLVLIGAWLMVAKPATGARSAAPSGLPPEIARMLEHLSPAAREAYAFAIERPDVLKHMPCYCGCEAAGHTSNHSCFVEELAGGGFTLDSHGST
ncbi:MAG: PCYCGC motif-containing (lipo)protein [Chloroflexota bacterium]